MRPRRTQETPHVEHSPVALVTGGGRRLGRQIVYALSEAGFRVAFSYHQSREGAKMAVRRIAEREGEAFAIRANIAKRSDVRRLVEAVKKKFGRIDLLVNNAAVFIHSPFLDTNDADWHHTLGVNLTGTFMCSQEVARVMLTQGGGKIVNIASLGGIQAWKEHVPYSVSKAGVIMLTRLMAKSLAPSIIVNAIAPGTIVIPGEETNSYDHIPTRKIPLQRHGTPKDITDLVIFLALSSQYITGQVFPIDGGRSI